MSNQHNAHQMLSDLGRLLKRKNEILEDTKRQITGLKIEIRDILKENDMKKFEDKNNNLKISVTYPYAWDHGLFKMENPELTKRYFTEETITKIKDVYDRKLIHKNHPDIYDKYKLALTPRLSVK